jgi:ADP-ribosyl-[dinitrogen reductase] hydrolase
MQQKFVFDINYRAKACILGAMIADSLGSTLEFNNSTNAKEILKKFKNFENGLVGQGPFSLLPGQFTDDSEMALAIMSVIAAHGKYDQKMVAQAYHQWYLSHPFDIGGTTANAIKETNVNNMIKAAANLNNNSMSNGFLMRQFGIVGMYHNKSHKELLTALKNDVILTHSHPEILHIAIFYGTLLWLAIQGKPSMDIYNFGKKNFTHCPLIVAIYDAIDNNKESFICYYNKYSLSEADSFMSGFVGYALWMLLLCIKYHTNYRDAVIEVVGYGGDTDTNACIVGAVMAALYPNTIPVIWINDLFNCQATARYNNYSFANPKVWKHWLP